MNCFIWTPSYKKCFLYLYTCVRFLAKVPECLSNFSKYAFYLSWLLFRSVEVNQKEIWALKQVKKQNWIKVTKIYTLHCSIVLVELWNISSQFLNKDLRNKNESSIQAKRYY